MVTKSGIMLGLGETEPELFQAMDDLREVGCQVLTLGHISGPHRSSPGGKLRHAGAIRSLRRYRARKGFAHVASGPLVRSSYHAADFHPVVR